MKRRIVSTVLRTREFKEATNLGLQFVSTPRQVQNGTIALAGTVKGRPIAYSLTATGAVIGNKKVTRQVFGESEIQQYREGMKAIIDLVQKRT